MGERIEDQLLALREQLMRLSVNAQKLNTVPMKEPVTLEVRPLPMLSFSSNTHIQSVLQVSYKHDYCIA